MPRFHLPKSQLLLCFGFTCKTFLTLFIFLLIATFSSAQDLLLGLTSSGGPNGGGTAFSVKTTGADFKVEHNFINYGKNPQGNLIKGADGNFYGMTSLGGKANRGTIFKMTSGGAITILRHLNTVDGINPQGSLIQAADNNFYGMAYGGGQYGYGTIFRISAAGAFSVLHSFNGTNGKNPSASLIIGTDGNLYGLTPFGGSSNMGVIFSISLSGVFQLRTSLFIDRNPYGNLVQGSDGRFYGFASSDDDDGQGTIFNYSSSFTNSGARYLSASLGTKPYGSLIKASNGVLYGMTSMGGNFGGGTIIRYDINSTTTPIKVIAHFNSSTTGANPKGNLWEGYKDGHFYGMTANGGQYGGGTIFKVNLTDGKITVLRHLQKTTDGSRPYGSLFRNASDGFYYGMTSEGGTGSSSTTALNGTIFKIDATGTSFSVLNILPDANKGMKPQKSLLLAKDGYYYGTTLAGGKYDAGTLFKLSSSGAYTTLRSFNPSIDGSSPKGTLMQASDGSIYGTTSLGGNYNSGTLFQLSLSGVFSTPYHFTTATGVYPECKLLQGKDGSLYGTTRLGGTNNKGVIFKYSTATGYTVIRSFSGTTDGASPTGGLIQAADGTFYGTATSGGSFGFGTIFKLVGTTFTVLRHLDATTGKYCYGSLTLGSDGNLYGMTWYGGTSNGGTLFKIIQATNTFNVLYNFAAGSYPKDNLVQGSDGTLYGMTSAGGIYNEGTIFKITSAGAYILLLDFSSKVHGSTPLGSLILRKVNTATSTVRINSGGPTVVTASGTFVADTYFTGSTGTFATTAAIANTDNDVLYQDYRRAATAGGTFGYHIPVTNGTYSVKLRFAEIYFTAVGQRKFNITAEGAAWISNYDIYAGAGAKNFAVSLTKSINVSDGYLDLSFISVVERACISAIEIVPATLVTSTQASDVPLPVVEEQTAVSGMLYPNPLRDRLTLVLAAPVEQASITITNTLGTVVHRQELHLNGKRVFEMNVAALRPSVYFLNVQTSTGKQTYKFVKE
jgi:uncharacterized repeat protein (TIGR03803 family)